MCVCVCFFLSLQKSLFRKKKKNGKRGISKKEDLAAQAVKNLSRFLIDILELTLLERSSLSLFFAVHQRQLKNLHPGRLTAGTWEYTCLKRKIIFETIIFRFKLLIFWGVHHLFLFPKVLAQQALEPSLRRFIPLNAGYLTNQSQTNSPFSSGLIAKRKKEDMFGQPFGWTWFALSWLQMIFSLPSFQIKTNAKIKNDQNFFAKKNISLKKRTTSF